jgi:hypothetical protein
MRTHAMTTIIGAAAALIAMNAHADSVPYYPDAGTPNTQEYTFTATTSGDVTAYYAGTPTNPTDTDVLGMEVNDVETGITGLTNHGSTIGQSLDLGYATAGATLTFLIINQTIGDTFYSNPALNTGGYNQIYSTDFSGSSSLPAGVFLGFGDVPDDSPYFDYAATNFVLTNATMEPASPVPLPATTWLMLSGLGGLGALIRKRKFV